jgi:putative acetyltransferase
MQETTQARVRAVTRSDVPAVVALVGTVLAEFGFTFGAGSDTDSQLLGLPESYEHSGGRFWIATQDGAGVIGTCGVYPVTARSFELRKMYLASAARGLGVGRRLLAESIAFAHERDADELVLDTTEQMTRARAFYEAHGFVRDDRQIRGARCTRGYRLDLRAR